MTDLDHLQSRYLDLVRRRRMYSGLMLIVFFALLAGGFQIADARNAGGFWQGLPHVFDYPAELIAEAWAKSAKIPGLLWHYLPALIETLNIAAVSTLVGGIGGGVLALLGTRDLSPWPLLVAPIRRLLDIMRAVPEVVIALILIFVLGGGPVPAMIAIAFHTTGALGKLFSEVVENADLKPVEGLESVGAGWLQRMWLAIMPQVAPNWLGYALLRFEINIRASAILGFVGAGGIGYELRNAISWGPGRFDAAASIFLLLFLTIVAIDQASSVIRNRLIHGAAA